MAITYVRGTNHPTIIVQPSTSVNGFATVSPNWVFATVMVVYPGCMTYAVGDSVFFDKSKAVRFLYGSTNYYALDQQYIYFAETPAVIIP